MNGKSEAP